MPDVIGELAGQQLIMLLLALGGCVLFKLGLIPKTSMGSIINMTICLFLPCNILYAFLVSFDMHMLRSFAAVFLIASFIQVVSLVFAKFLYNRYAPDKKSVLQFATSNSNSILLGVPVAESIYGNIGMSYASIYTIPGRIVLWSAGVAYFTKPMGKRAILKVSLTHPCMVAVFLGFVFALFNVQFPAPILSALNQFGACTTPVSMIVIGATLAEVKLRDLADASVLFLALIRLGVLPLIVYAVCRLFSLSTEVTGISVLLTAMPAGATTTIMAGKYNGNTAFASKCVVITTILSFVSTILWSMVL
jgi:predicted permease